MVLLFASLKLLASPTVWDYDGDGKTDLVVTRYRDNVVTWHILKSSEGHYSTVFGDYIPQVRGDGGMPGDFDGDGKYDIGVLRNTPEDNFHHFYLLNSNGTGVSHFQWGLKTDWIMLQDYDGDSKTDFGVYRGGWWYILNSSDGSFRAEKFGESVIGSHIDKPIYGDYDGDGKADLAVIRSSGFSQMPIPITFYIKHSSNGNWQSQTIGDRRADIVVPGDYDGDGKTDIALWGGENIEYGDGRWKWIRSSDGQYESVRFGYPGDRTVQGDYDGDGKTDYALYRRGLIPHSQNYFYILGSSSGFHAIAWGRSTIDETPMSWFSR